MSKTNIYLDPLNQAVADELASEPPIEDLTVKQFRALFKRLQQHDPIPGVTRTSFTVPFEDGVQAFVFKPSGARGDLPVIFYLHGGGWIFGECVTTVYFNISFVSNISSAQRHTIVFAPI